MSKEPTPKKQVSFITALALWMIRWTAVLGGLGLASIYFDVAWVMGLGLIGALLDLGLVLLKEARLAEKRRQAQDTLAKIEETIVESDRSENP